MNNRSKQRRGATMVFVVILLPVLFALSGMAVNFAYIQVVRTKVQIVTDAAARAAGREFVVTSDPSLALKAAQDIAALNPLDNNFVVPIQAGDLQFGNSTRSGSNQKFAFDADGSSGNSVRITTTALANGAGNAPKPFFPIFGSNFEIRPTVSATNTQSTLDAVLVVDRSGSMRWTAVSGEASVPGPTPQSVPLNSRWMDLVDAVDTFFNELNNSVGIENVGLASYASTSSSDVPMTTEYGSIQASLDARSASFPGGGTNIESGIDSGISVLTDPNTSRDWAVRVLILMSDGVASSGSDTMAAANRAVALGIPIYTVSFSDGADQTVMAQVAATTGGRHYHADNSTQLNEAFRSIAQSIPSLMTQ